MTRDNQINPCKILAHTSIDVVSTQRKPIPNQRLIEDPMQNDAIESTITCRRKRVRQFRNHNLKEECGLIAANKSDRETRPLEDTQKGLNTSSSVIEAKSS